jgi:gluconokinase
MGVSGAGKTLIGKLLAQSLGWKFLDADDLHSLRNKRKMHAGVALTDADRKPWLTRVRHAVERFLHEGVDAIVACSALKRSYRAEIVVDPSQVKVVYLRGDKDLIALRLSARTGHFMSNELLQSQFDTLEEPPGAIVIDIARTPDEIVNAIRSALRI